jgi:G:T/U-mismatch repair DNA glycosylase
MLPEILTRNLFVLFAGTAVTKMSDDLGFYHLDKDDKFWWMLEYGSLTQGPVVSPQERKIIYDTFKTHALNDIYRQLFFEKKERLLTGWKIGLTDLNRRVVVEGIDHPDAAPTPEDVRKFVATVKKHQPRIVAFIAGLDVFESCFKPLYPAVNRKRGRQEVSIDGSEVWLLGPTSGRGKDNKALENVFEALGERVKALS